MEAKLPRSEEWRRRIALGAAAVIFFVVTGMLAMRVHALGYPSPDETAAKVFMERVAAGLPLAIPEPFNTTLGNIVHPRSTTVAGGAIVPQGFPIQMALWGALSRVTRLPVWLWTPLLASLALPMLYPLFSIAFPRPIAFVAALLSFVHPAVLYYTIRGLYPNAAQLFLLTLSMFLFQKSALWQWALGGGLLALTLAVRPSEALWIVPGVALIFWWNRQRGLPRNLAAASVAACVVGFGAFALHHALYGPRLIGYDLGKAANVGLGGSGFSEMAILKHGWQYLGALFWWWTIPTAVGIIGVMRDCRNWHTPILRYATLVALIGSMQLLVYGSWALRDTVSEHEVTIGTSFVRYWLPLYVLPLPFAAWGLERLWFRKFVVGVLVVFSLVYPTVWGFESIASATRSAQSARLLLARAKQSIPENSVLLVERSDKIFWPAYRVVTGSAEPEKVLRVLPRVAEKAPLYFHRDSRLAFASFWNAQHLATVGLAFGPAVVLDSDNELLSVVSQL